MRNRKIYEIEYRLLQRDGEYRKVSLRVVSVLETDGTVRERVGMGRDITERKGAEKELALYRHHLEEIVAQRTGELAGSGVQVEIKPLPVSHGDEPMIQRLRTNLLDNAIKFTRRVKDGAEALDFVFRTRPYAGVPNGVKPKAILLDLRLPRVDGIEVLRRLESNEHTGEIPIADTIAKLGLYWLVINRVP